MYIVGLTGGIGSGKTAVSDRFADKDIAIVDADVAARTVVEAGTPALEQISQRFGESILTNNGELDRAKLREIVFANPEDKKWLEELLHPLIGAQLFKEMDEATSPFILFVSPLLVESGQNVMCDRVLLVDVPEELQLQRTMSRDDNDEAQVKAIMAAQTSREERQSKADDIVVNDKDLNHIAAEVDKLYEQYLVFAAEKSANEG